MEDTEPMVAKALFEYGVNRAKIESNNGGRGFARSVNSILKQEYKSNKTKVRWFHQSENKIARILSNSTWVMNHIYYPKNWKDRWPDTTRQCTSISGKGTTRMTMHQTRLRE